MCFCSTLDYEASLLSWPCESDAQCLSKQLLAVCKPFFRARINCVEEFSDTPRQTKKARMLGVNLQLTETKAALLLTSSSLAVEFCIKLCLYQTGLLQFEVTRRFGLKYYVFMKMLINVSWIFKKDIEYSFQLRNVPKEKQFVPDEYLPESHTTKKS